MNTHDASLAKRLATEVSTPQSAILLAAGLGKRMRPLTATRPKPLIEVAGRALLDHAIDKLREAGVERVIVNVHYLADSIEAHLAARDHGVEVLISDERERLLETGGGVLRALPMVKGDPFYVVNSDNLWIDGSVNTLRLLAQRWDDAVMDGLLLLVPLARAVGYDGPGDFTMDAAGQLRRRQERRIAPFVFSGVQLLSRRILEDAPEGPFSLNLLYDRALERGRLAGVAHPGLWFHVGTPQALAEAQAFMASG